MPDAELNTIFEAMRSYNPRRRRNAVERARLLSPDQMLLLLEKHLDEQKQNARFTHPLYITVLILSVCLALLTAWGVYYRVWEPKIMSRWLLFWLGLTFCAVLPIELVERSWLRTKCLQKMLTGQRNKSYVGLMLMALALSDTKTEAKAKLRETLAELIPSLTKEDAASWNARQRSAFCYPVRILVSDWVTRNMPGQKAKRQFELALRVIKLLEQIGGKQELFLIQQAAKTPGKTRRDRQLRQAAQECLPYLELRAGEEQQAKTLLRPAGTSDVSPETLLRAATTAESRTPSEQLLRASKK